MIKYKLPTSGGSLMRSNLVAPPKDMSFKPTWMKNSATGAFNASQKQSPAGSAKTEYKRDKQPNCCQIRVEIHAPELIKPAERTDCVMTISEQDLVAAVAQMRTLKQRIGQFAGTKKQSASLITIPTQIERKLYRQVTARSDLLNDKSVKVKLNGFVYDKVQKPLGAKQQKNKLLPEMSHSPSPSDLSATPSTCRSRSDEDSANVEVVSASSRPPRPAYLIERDCHIFGGCMDDDAEDEFFVSSGAVYQSWPCVHEPGYVPQPVCDLSEHWCRVSLLSRSDDKVSYTLSEAPSAKSNNQLASYSTKNFGMVNIMHVANQRSRRRGVKKTKRDLNSLTESSSSSRTLSDDEESESSDDSESLIAYKQRHAVGLAAHRCVNFNHTKFSSQLNISMNKQRGGNLFENTCSSHSSTEDLWQNLRYKVTAQRPTNLTASCRCESTITNNTRVDFASQMRFGLNYDFIAGELIDDMTTIPSQYTTSSTRQPMSLSISNQLIC